MRGCSGGLCEGRCFKGCGCCPMKIISCNVRGLGIFEKRKVVRKLVGEEKKSSILCIQETKISTLNDFLCFSLCCSSPHGYSFRPSVGAFGGVLIMWDNEDVEIGFSYSFYHVLAVGGRFIQSNEDFFLFNVYAPCDVGCQHVLWESLSSRLANYVRRNVCVCGDFNVVRGVEEWRSVGLLPILLGTYSFNSFIDDKYLAELPLVSYRFTWYRDDPII